MRRRISRAHLAYLAHFHPFPATVEVEVCNPVFKFSPYSPDHMGQCHVKDMDSSLLELFLLLGLALRSGICGHMNRGRAYLTCSRAQGVALWFYLHVESKGQNQGTNQIEADS